MSIEWDVPRQSVAVSGSFAFANGGDHLNVFDLHDPTRVRLVAEVKVDGSIAALAESGGHLYAAGSRGSWGPGESDRARLHVFDASDPPSLRLVALSEMPGHATGIALLGNHACLAGENLEVIDISQPTSPRRVGGCPGHGGGWEGRVAALGGRACVLGDGLLRVFDISDPTKPLVLGECAGGGSDLNATAGYVFAAAGSAGVEVFDVRDPAHPRRIGGNSAFDAHALAIGDGRLHVAAGEQGLVILDLHPPPRLEGFHLGADGFHLRLHGITGQVIRVERSIDLLTWIPFATVPISANGGTLIDPAANAQPFLFYRAVSRP